MTFSGHYEFLAPRGAGKSAYRDALCGLINSKSAVKALRSRSAAFAACGRRFLPGFAVKSPELSCRAGRIISKTFHKRNLLELKAHEEFLDEYKETAALLESLPAGTDSFMYWFRIVSGRYQLSKRYLKPDEIICYGGGFVFCLEHLFGKAETGYIEEVLSVLPKPRLLIEIKAEEKSLIKARQGRGDTGPLPEKVRQETASTEKLSALAGRQSIKIVSFFNDYSGVRFTADTESEILKSLPDAGR